MLFTCQLVTLLHYKLLPSCFQGTTAKCRESSRRSAPFGHLLVLRLAGLYGLLIALIFFLHRLRNLRAVQATPPSSSVGVGVLDGNGVSPRSIFHIFERMRPLGLYSFITLRLRANREPQAW